jgi:hypothetical protein
MITLCQVIFIVYAIIAIGIPIYGIYFLVRVFIRKNPMFVCEYFHKHLAPEKPIEYNGRLCGICPRCYRTIYLSRNSWREIEF